MTTASFPEEVSQWAGWLARGELTELAWFSYPAVVPQGPRMGEETNCAGYCISPSKKQSRSCWAPRQKAGGRDHPAGMGWMWFFRFLYLVEIVLLVQDELQRVKERREKGVIHNWGLRLNCPSRSISAVAAVTETCQFGAFFFLDSHTGKKKGWGATRQ